MRYHVLGLGAIGPLVAHHLRQSLPTAPISLITRNTRGYDPDRPPPPGSPKSSPFTISVTRDGHTTVSSNYDVELSHDGVLGRRDSEALSTERKRSTLWKPSKSKSEPPNGDITSLIVCLKAPETLSALEKLRPRLSRSSVITLLQNGVGVFDELCHSLWPDPATRPNFIIATTTHGARRVIEEDENPRDLNQGRKIIHATQPGTGELRFGIVPDPRKEVDFERWLWGGAVGTLPILAPPSSPSLPLTRPPRATVDLRPLHSTLEALLSLSHLTPTLLPMPHLHHHLLLKVAINSIINPLTAVIGAGGLPNGILMTGVPGFRLMRQLAEETSAVLTAYLHSLAHPHTPASDMIRMFSIESIVKSVLTVVRSTAANQSSMAFDIRGGRKTEIKYINGYLINLGERLGVHTTRHRMLYDMVLFTAEISGLNPELASPFGTALRSRRNEMSQKLTGLLAKSPKELELEQRRLDLQEQKLDLERQKLKLARADRRKIKTELKHDRISDILGVRAPRRTEFVTAVRNQRDDLVGMVERGEAERYPAVLRRLDSPVIKGYMKRLTTEGKGFELTEPGLKASEEISEGEWSDVDSDAYAPTSSARASASRTASANDVDTRARDKPGSSSSSNTPTKPAAFSLDELIAASARQERTWDIPSSPPKARGLSKKKSSTPSLSTQTIRTSTSASTEPSADIPALQSIPPHPSCINSLSSPELESREAPSVPSVIDPSITSAPHAERSWSNSGGTTSGYTVSLGSTSQGSPGQPANPSPKEFASDLDNLISDAPRQERTWGDRAAIAKQDGGKFTTSRSSGS